MRRVIKYMSFVPMLLCTLCFFFCSASIASSATLDNQVLNSNTTSSESTTSLQESSEPQEESVNISSMIFDHIGDSYDWHLWTTKSGKHVSIPLPVIVHSSTTGWHCFMSEKLHHGSYEGFSISPAGQPDEGKLVELQADGTFLKPFDISLTKNVIALIISSIVLVVIVLKTASWYKTHDSEKEAPTGIAALMEPFIMMVNDSIIKESVGPEYRKYSPFLLTIFFFIFLNNLMGLIPFFPGGANVTGNIAVTMVLALCTFFAVNVFGNKHYWKEILWPDVPVWLKFPIPIMQTIEIFGVFTKPFSLMVRLFANILAGHAMILGLVSVIFITAKLGPVINGSMTFVTMLFGVFMNCLELLVAFIQAYVFTMLSSVFIGMSRPKHE